MSDTTPEVGPSPILVPRCCGSCARMLPHMSGRNICEIWGELQVPPLVTVCTRYTAVDWAEDWNEALDGRTDSGTI